MMKESKPISVPTTPVNNILVSLLAFSTTTSQAERRKRFDKASLDELATNMKDLGQLQPIVVRPVNSHWEVVAGERRVLAAQKAGFEYLAASVRELSDQQVLEVQLAENLQREGLHELIEAETYESLMKLHGMSVEELIPKVGKSRAYVYGRLKLTDLCPDGRKAFYDGKLNASTALLVARIPLENLQTKAIKDIAEGRDPMTYRQAQEHIHRNYMLGLGTAPFPTGDETLCKGAVACGRCPKNTLSQPELFGDVKGGSAGVCTDPSCFNAKSKAWRERRVEQAKAAGHQVIDGSAAKKVSPYAHQITGGFVSLDSTCYDDGKQRKYREILGKDFKPALLVTPKRNYASDEPELIEIAPVAALRGLIKRPTSSRSSASDGAREKKDRAKREANRKFSHRVIERLIARAPAALGRPELQTIAESLSQYGLEDEEALCTIMGWPAKRGFSIDDQIRKLAEKDLMKLIYALLLWSELSYNGDLNQPIRDAAKRARIDLKKLRREFDAEQKIAAKPPAAQPAKRKS